MGQAQVSEADYRCEVLLVQHSKMTLLPLGITATTIRSENDLRGAEGLNGNGAEG